MACASPPHMPVRYVTTVSGCRRRLSCVACLSLLACSPSYLLAHNLVPFSTASPRSNVLLKGTPYQYAAAPGTPGSPGPLAAPDCRGYSAKIADLGLARQVGGP